MAVGLAPGFKYSEQSPKKISRGQFNALAKKYGLPAKAFWQISQGESDHRPYIQQHDPGDSMVGYGLFQLTPNAWGGGAAKQKFDQLGGTRGMQNLENQFKMARFLYKSAGNSFKPWYGTRFLTDRSGEGHLGPVRKGMQVPGNVGAGASSGGRTPKGLAFNPNAADTGTAIVDALAAMNQRPQRQVTAPSAPSFAAGVALPEGYTPAATSSGGAQGSGTDSFKAALDAIVKSSSNPANALTTGGKRIPGQKTAGGASGGGARPAKGKYDIKELFWQGQGGINVKDNAKVQQGFVTGHEDHVHVAAGPKGVVSLGKLAQQMGLHVGENPHFGGVAPVHVPNSNHYSGQAIDVSGDAKKMARFAHVVARMRK